MSASDILVPEMLWNNMGIVDITQARYSAGMSTGLTESQLASYMARVNYSFNDRYLLTVSGRYDGSSVYITNGTNVVNLSVTGGYFNTKIGCASATKEGVAGAVTGGVFTESAKNNTAAALIATGYSFVENGDGTYTVKQQ